MAEVLATLRKRSHNSAFHNVANERDTVFGKHVDIRFSNCVAWSATASVAAFPTWEKSPTVGLWNQVAAVSLAVFHSSLGK